MTSPKREMNFFIKAGHEDPGASFSHDCGGKRYLDPTEIVTGMFVSAPSARIANTYAGETLSEQLEWLCTCDCEKMDFLVDDDNTPETVAIYERWSGSRYFVLDPVDPDDQAAIESLKEDDSAYTDSRPRAEALAIYEEWKREHPTHLAETT